MVDLLKPRDAQGVEAALQWALAENKALEVVGAGSKRAVGRPSQTDATLDVSGLRGVTLYEPEELVLSARAGTPLADIEALLAVHHQELAFEPMDLGPLMGAAAGAATIGGVLAANLSGPRRIKTGAARDHFLGVTAVSGRGETFKSGGRVVKNVTGYDLCKLVAGSWGTLAVMTEVTLKVLPRAETVATVLVLGLEPAAAVAAMTEAMGSACDVSGAAHLPAPLAARMPSPVVAAAGAAVTALRLEGVAPSVRHRRGALEALLRHVGALATLDEQGSRMLWRAVRDVAPLVSGADGTDRVLWRISTMPSEGAALAASLQSAAEAEVVLDWAGGLIWAALPLSDDAGARLVRGALGDRGHATLIRAPAAIRAAVDVFQPQAPGLAALSKRVKDGFDPRGLLNPGRIWAGI